MFVHDDLGEKVIGILEDRNLPLEFKAVFALYAELCKKINSTASLEILLEITTKFANAITTLKREKVTIEESIAPGLFLGNHQHVMLLTPTTDDAVNLALKIGSDHEKGVLVYDTSPEHATWLQNRLQWTTKNIEFVTEFAEPKFPLILEGLYNIQEIRSLLLDRLNKASKKGFVKGISLTATQPLLRVLQENAALNSFFELQKMLTEEVGNMQTQWISMYSLSELHLLKNLKLSVYLITAGVQAHTNLIMYDGKKFQYDKSAVTAAYKKILELETYSLIDISRILLAKNVERPPQSTPTANLWQCDKCQFSLKTFKDLWEHKKAYHGYAKKVLVVDDSSSVLDHTIRILTELNYKIEKAYNGTEALSKYTTFKPDIVILDLLMPVMDGIEALERILKIDKGANVIITSQPGTADTLKRCLELGARGYIIKPFSSKELITAMLNTEKIMQDLTDPTGQANISDHNDALYPVTLSLPLTEEIEQAANMITNENKS